MGCEFFFFLAVPPHESAWGGFGLGTLTSPLCGRGTCEYSSYLACERYRPRVPSQKFVPGGVPPTTASLSPRGRGQRPEEVLARVEKKKKLWTGRDIKLAAVPPHLCSLFLSSTSHILPFFFVVFFWSSSSQTNLLVTVLQAVSCHLLLVLRILLL